MLARRVLPVRAFRGYAAKVGLREALRPGGPYIPPLKYLGAAVISSLGVSFLAMRDGDSVVVEEGYDWDENWDIPIANLAEGAPPTAVRDLDLAGQQRSTQNAAVARRHIVFVRHAQLSEDADEKEAARHAGVPGAASAEVLSDVGRRQAELTGARIADVFGAVAAIYHAESPEAKATAHAIRSAAKKKRPGVPPPACVASQLLSEGVPRIPSPAPAALLAADEGEVFRDLTRAESALRAHVWTPLGAEDDTVNVDVIVGHGNMMRYLVCRAMQLPPGAWSRLASYNCAITWLDIDASGAVLMREFGGVGHLPSDAITYK